MPTIQVNAGTEVVIDHDNNTISKRYKGQTYEIYVLNEDWVKKFTHCRVCGKPLTDENAAYAFYKLETRTCSTECLNKEWLKQHACCELATPTHCVCAASFTCPIHGETHKGTHD